MKKFYKIQFLILILSLSVGENQCIAQNKKYKARLSVEIEKIMNGESSLIVHVKFKGEKGYQPASGLNLNVYQQQNEDSLEMRGVIITDKNGTAKFQLKSLNNKHADSLIMHKFVIKIENDQHFKNTSKMIGYQDAYLTSKSVKKDSIDYIIAKLTDGMGNPVEGEKLKVMVQRLYAPLTIGKSSNRTDAYGKIQIPVIDPPPGIGGVLTFEVLLDSRKYGIVRDIFNAEVGKNIADKSTFDERTMWSPRNKTPIFLWIFPNIIIFGVWLIIVLIVSNLIKIYKS